MLKITYPATTVEIPAEEKVFYDYEELPKDIKKKIYEKYADGLHNRDVDDDVNINDIIETFRSFCNYFQVTGNYDCSLYDYNFKIYDFNDKAYNSAGEYLDINDYYNAKTTVRFLEKYFSKKLDWFARNHIEKVKKRKQFLRYKNTPKKIENFSRYTCNLNRYYAGAGFRNEDEPDFYFRNNMVFPKKCYEHDLWKHFGVWTDYFIIDAYEKFLDMCRRNKDTNLKDFFEIVCDTLTKACEKEEKYLFSEQCMVEKFNDNDILFDENGNNILYSDCFEKIKIINIKGVENND